jgi:hypothetical protein
VGIIKSDPRKRLPRVPNAERPRPDEKVWRVGEADLQNGWLGRHGKLSLLDTRLVFVPTPLDMLLRAKRREIPLDAITHITREPRDVNGAATGGRRVRVVVGDALCDYQVMLGDVDNWIDMMELVTNRRRGNSGQPPKIVVGRENYVNPLLAVMAEESTTS